MDSPRYKWHTFWGSNHFLFTSDHALQWSLFWDPLKIASAHPTLMAFRSSITKWWGKGGHEKEERRKKGIGRCGFLVATGCILGCSRVGIQKHGCGSNSTQVPFRELLIVTFSYPLHAVFKHVFWGVHKGASVLTHSQTRHHLLKLTKSLRIPLVKFARPWTHQRMWPSFKSFLPRLFPSLPRIPTALNTCHPRKEQFVWIRLQLKEPWLHQTSMDECVRSRRRNPRKSCRKLWMTTEENNLHLKLLKPNSFLIFTSLFHQNEKRKPYFGSLVSKLPFLSISSPFKKAKKLAHRPTPKTTNQPKPVASSQKHIAGRWRCFNIWVSRPTACCRATRRSWALSSWAAPGDTFACDLEKVVEQKWVAGWWNVFFVCVCVFLFFAFCGCSDYIDCVIGVFWLVFGFWLVQTHACFLYVRSMPFCEWQIPNLTKIFLDFWKGLKLPTSIL